MENEVANGNAANGHANEAPPDEARIEEYAKKGQSVPMAKHYIIRIDKQERRIESPTITGRDILALVDMTPETHKLYLHRRGNQPVQVQPDEEIDVRSPGVERFTTMAKGTTEGLQTRVTRRQFHLPQADEEYLTDLGLHWETVVDNSTQWLIVHEWRVPGGYNHEFVSLALMIPPGYSDCQIDMVYFLPALVRQDQRPIGALTQQPICGEVWQRWSRHRTASHPWRPGQDDVASHLGLVESWLSREFGGE